MPENDHDLIMQFARGTEALTLLTELDRLGKHFEQRKAEITKNYDIALNRVYQDFFGQVNGAIRHTVNRLADLQPDEIESPDDYAADD
jgi:hypothetical protein